MRWMVLAVLFVSSSIAQAGDWWNWRGPWQNGVSHEKNLPASWSPEGENLIWKAPFGSRSTPLVMNGRVYFINYDAVKIKEKDGAEKDVAETIQERVMCLDANTGKVVWQHKFNIFHTDIVTVRLGWTNLAGDPQTGNIYAHGTQGLFFCFDRDGKVLWSRSLTEEFGRVSGYGGRVTSPTVVDDLVVVGMAHSSWGDFAKGGNRWFAMNKLTGEMVWWADPAGQVKDTYYSVPVVAVIGGQKLIVSGGADGAVYAIKASTGEKVWGYTFGTGAINCSPVIDGNHVYIGHGEESPDNNIQGRVVCLDASQVENGQPKLVWQKDGVKARYTSPIYHEGRLYITDEIGKMYCLDGKTGKQLWKFSYGRNSRGSPVFADGKIYVGEVNSKFHILEPSDKKCVRLHEHYFPSPDGISDVEVNGSPAIANGRVYFSTSDEFFCIGVKDAKSEPVVVQTAAPEPTGKPGHVQIIPADVTVYAGASVKFQAKLYDTHGVFMKDVAAEWSLPTPPLPPGAKTSPPPLDGKIEAGVLTLDAKKPSQHGYVTAKVEGLVGKARVRVAPKIPYMQDFSKVPEGAVPAGWVNTQGKFTVATVNGEKLLRKVNDKSSPLVARGHAYVGLPTDTNYTIECDVQGSKAGDDLPEIGVGANRYTLLMVGNIQKLRLMSWDALPRIDQTVPFEFQPGVWYRMKLTVEVQNGTAVAKGKAWRCDQPEPDAWTAVAKDSRPNISGAPTIYGYVTGIPEGGAGTEIYYDNLKITPNK